MNTHKPETGKKGFASTTIYGLCCGFDADKRPVYVFETSLLLQVQVLMVDFSRKIEELQRKAGIIAPAHVVKVEDTAEDEGYTADG